MKKYFLTFSLVPGVVYAAGPNNIFDLFKLIFSWIGKTVPLLIGFTVLIIFWNLTQFVLHAGDEKERNKYKQFMIWGVVAVFLIISFWGIIYIIVDSFFGLGSPMLNNPGFADKNGNILP